MTTTVGVTPSDSASPAPPAWRPSGPGSLHLALAAVSIVAYVLAKILAGPASTIFEVIGVGACGWAWLATRALFDVRTPEARWPMVVGGLVALSGAASVLAPPDGLFARVAGNLYALVGSGALLLTFIEPMASYRSSLAPAERRFRLAFVAVYALLVAIAVLGVRASAQGPHDGAVKGACAVVGLVGLAAAVWRRAQHPLSVDGAAASRRVATADDHQLAARLTRLLAEAELETEPDLRIADVAMRLGVPEYRVSQCIGAALGFSNFNRWINHHRIARAKRLLADPAERRTILEIAFECGFASLGPFNRAFRVEAGMTPRAFRTESRAAWPS